VGYDVVVIGGGSAGCVRRRTAADDLSILLVAARPGCASLAELRAEIARSDFAPRTCNWGYIADWDRYGRRVAVPINSRRTTFPGSAIHSTIQALDELEIGA
jgi:DNA-binding transcriptional LysR family regulator